MLTAMAIQFVTTLIANRFLLDIELEWKRAWWLVLKDALDLYLITVLESSSLKKLTVRRATSLVERVGFASSVGYAGCPERGRRSVLGSTYHSVERI